MDVPESRYAKSVDVHVAYCIRGDGPVDLVYIPGWVSNIELMWEDRWMRAWLDRLATFSRLIAFDKRVPDSPTGCRTVDSRTLRLAWTTSKR